MELPLNSKPVETLLERVLCMNIQSSDYFKDLSRLKTCSEVIDEVYNQVDHVEPWMSGNCRGPSTAFCLLYKYYTMNLTSKQMQQLLDHEDSPYIRAVGFLFLRYFVDPKVLWDWFEPYLSDDEEFSPGSSGAMTTMGVYIRDLLLDMYYFDTLLPRIPVPISRQITAELERMNLPTKASGTTGNGPRHADDTARRPPSVKAALSVSFGQRAPHRTTARESDPTRRPAARPPAHREEYRGSDREKERERDREKARDVDRERRDRERGAERFEADRERRDRDRDRAPERSDRRDADYHKDRRDREIDRDRRDVDRERRDRDRDRDRGKDRDRDREKEREREKDRERERERERDRERGRDRQRDREKEYSRERSRPRSRSRSPMRSSYRGNSREKEMRDATNGSGSASNPTLQKLKDMYGDDSGSGRPSTSEYGKMSREGTAEDVIRLGGQKWK